MCIFNIPRSTSQVYKLPYDFTTISIKASGLRPGVGLKHFSPRDLVQIRRLVHESGVTGLQPRTWASPPGSIPTPCPDPRCACASPVALSYSFPLSPFSVYPLNHRGYSLPYVPYSTLQPRLSPTTHPHISQTLLFISQLSNDHCMVKKSTT